jgi:hypothetical protein
LVEPPDRETAAIAFSSESGVMMWLGRRSSSSTRITSRPASSATCCFSPSIAGTIAEPIGDTPMTSNAQAIVFAVN